MNYFDIFIAIPLAWAAYKGFSKGFINQAASLVALLAGILGAIKFSGFTAEVLTSEFDIKTQYLSLIAFAITFIGIVVAVHFVARMVDKLLSAAALGFVNRLAGLLFGLIKTAFIISVLLVILNNADKKLNFLPREKIEESYLYQPLSAFAPMIFPYLQFDQIRNPIEEHDINMPALDKQT
jgi:membrane protein required for colicin V production